MLPPEGASSFGVLPLGGLLPPREGVLPPGVCFLRGGRVFPLGGPGGDPPGTATAADGTHPTGMHSCYICVLA